MTGVGTIVSESFDPVIELKRPRNFEALQMQKRWYDEEREEVE